MTCRSANMPTCLASKPVSQEFASWLTAGPLRVVLPQEIIPMGRLPTSFRRGNRRKIWTEGKGRWILALSTQMRSRCRAASN